MELQGAQQNTGGASAKVSSIFAYTSCFQSPAAYTKIVHVERKPQYCKMRKTFDLISVCLLLFFWVCSRWLVVSTGTWYLGCNVSPKVIFGGTTGWGDESWTALRR